MTFCVILTSVSPRRTSRNFYIVDLYRSAFRVAREVVQPEFAQGFRLELPCHRQHRSDADAVSARFPAITAGL